MSVRIDTNTNIDNILFQENIIINKTTQLYGEIIKQLNPLKNKNVEKIINFLNILNSNKINGKTIFGDIVHIVNNYRKINFSNFTDIETKTSLFGKYNLTLMETNQQYITIDPTIIQILIFDDKIENEDIVYSLKLIIRDNTTLTLRYSTKLFPTIDNKIFSKITNFVKLDNFINFNKHLHTSSFNDFSNELLKFMTTYVKFYNYYKKCYTISGSKYVDYQLKYISILGKARFKNSDIIYRTAILTDYIMSNLLFSSPAYGFISGGYKGFKQFAYGITRSGYEIAKKYNRPILTIMCKEGKHDSHEYSDATLIYGEHWGEDTIALSQLTDGAIIIAPFGGWTYVECLALLAQRKIVGIYNDLFNILNYEEIKSKSKLINEEKESLSTMLEGTYDHKTLSSFINNNELVNENKNKNDNKIFFHFSNSEQESIINYYINYYLILLYLINKANILNESDTFLLPKGELVFLSFGQLKDCIKLGIQILSYLKTLFKAGQSNLINKNEEDTTYFNQFTELLEAFNKIKKEINMFVSKYLNTINIIYDKINDNNKEYQNKIPKKCDGIWIKPAFNLIEACVKLTENGKKTADKINEAGINARKEEAREKQVWEEKVRQEEEAKIDYQVRLSEYYSKVSRSTSRLGGTCNGKVKQPLINILDEYKIDEDNLANHIIFKNLNTNIIFVFSDILYLTSYLNTNLNISTFQNNIHDKIIKLSNMTKIKNAANILADSDKLIDLNRSIDGMYDSNKKEINQHHLIREKYSFVIDNETCNNLILIKPNERSHPRSAPRSAPISAPRSRSRSAKSPPKAPPRSTPTAGGSKKKSKRI